MKKKQRVKRPKVKPNKITVLGKITTCYRDGLCDILIDEKRKVKGRVSGELRRYLTHHKDRLLVGDHVLIEFDIHDLSLGLIRKIEKNIGGKKNG